LQQFIRDRINERLKYALAEENSRVPGEDKVEPGTPAPAEPEEVRKDKRIVTTAEEIEGYYAVKAILHGAVDARRVFMRDMVTQCGILLDDTLRKPICRFHFDSAQMYLGLIDQQKREERVPIESVDDIYSHADRLIATVGYYGG
jgi:predicted type IV restriction endonuclease